MNPENTWNQIKDLRDSQKEHLEFSEERGKAQRTEWTQR